MFLPLAAQLFEWFKLEASVILSACKAYKPQPNAPKLLAHTRNSQGTVSIDTTLQVGWVRAGWLALAGWLAGPGAQPEWDALCGKQARGTCACGQYINVWDPSRSPPLATPLPRHALHKSKPR